MGEPKVLWAETDDGGKVRRRVIFEHGTAYPEPQRPKESNPEEFGEPFDAGDETAILRAWGKSEWERAGELEAAVGRLAFSLGEEKARNGVAFGEGYTRGMKEAAEERLAFACVIEALFGGERYREDNEGDRVRITAEEVFAKIAELKKRVDDAEYRARLAGTVRMPMPELRPLMMVRFPPSFAPTGEEVAKIADSMRALSDALRAIEGEEIAGEFAPRARVLWLRSFDDFANFERVGKAIEDVGFVATSLEHALRGWDYASDADAKYVGRLRAALNATVATISDLCVLADVVRARSELFGATAAEIAKLIGGSSAVIPEQPRVEFVPSLMSAAKEEIVTAANEWAPLYREHGPGDPDIGGAYRDARLRLSQAVRDLERLEGKVVPPFGPEERRVMEHVRTREVARSIAERMAEAMGQPYEVRGPLGVERFEPPKDGSMVEHEANRMAREAPEREARAAASPDLRPGISGSDPAVYEPLAEGPFVMRVPTFSSPSAAAVGPVVVAGSSRAPLPGTDPEAARVAIEALRALPGDALEVRRLRSVMSRAAGLLVPLAVKKADGSFWDPLREATRLLAVEAEPAVEFPPYRMAGQTEVLRTSTAPGEIAAPGEMAKLCVKCGAQMGVHLIFADVNGGGLECPKPAEQFTLADAEHGR